MLYPAAERSEREKLCTEIKKVPKEEIAFLLKYDTPDVVAAAVVKLRNLLKGRRSSGTPPLPTVAHGGGNGARGVKLAGAEPRALTTASMQQTIVELLARWTTAKGTTPTEPIVWGTMMTSIICDRAGALSDHVCALRVFFWEDTTRVTSCGGRVFIPPFRVGGGRGLKGSTAVGSNK